MRAAVNEEYGPPDVVRVTTDAPVPTPGRGEVLVRVHSAAVTSADARLRAGRFPRGLAVPARLAFGVRRPRSTILGSSFSGVIDSVGPGVVGADAAWIEPGHDVCSMTGARMGAHAEFVIAKARKLVAKPATVSHDEAAGLLFGGTTALHYLREKSGLTSGRSVLVIGASGAVGSMAVQIAHHLGSRVTTVTSGANVALMARLGATTTLDYEVDPLTGVSERFDVVLDAVGALPGMTGRRWVADGGKLLLPAADLRQMLSARSDVAAGPAPEDPAVFRELLEMVSSRALQVVIESCRSMDDIQDAYRRIDSGRKVGNIVVNP